MGVQVAVQLAHSRVAGLGDRLSQEDQAEAFLLPCGPNPEAHSGTSPTSQVQLVFRGRDTERTSTGGVSASHRENRARGVGRPVAILANIFRCSDLHGVGPGEGTGILHVKTGE